MTVVDAHVHLLPGRLGEKVIEDLGLSPAAQTAVLGGTARLRAEIRT